MKDNMPSEWYKEHWHLMTDIEAFKEYFRESHSSESWQTGDCQQPDRDVQEHHGEMTYSQRRSRIFSFLSRICELSNFNHTEYRGQSRIFFFFSCPELSNFCLPWPSAILRVIKRNSIIRKFGIKKKYRSEKNIRDTPWHSVWYRQDIEGNDSVIFSDLGVKVSSLMVIGC